MRRERPGGLAPGEKSLAVRLTLASPDATLTDDQIEGAARDDGSRTPGRNRPVLMASRRLRSSWARRPRGRERSISTNNSGELVLITRLELDLSGAPLYPYR